MNKVKQGSNMYQFLNYTWNPIKGTCPHQCRYCYVPSALRGKPWGDLRLDSKALNEDLGASNIIFVGSSCDMWADYIPDKWIDDVIHHCYEYSNKYLFQTKNPERYFDWASYYLPDNSIIGVTIETNRHYDFISLAPRTEQRKTVMAEIAGTKFVSIEPIMDFDLDEMVSWIQQIKPEFVSIGADSGRNNLPEPTGEKVLALIDRLKKFTEVKTKTNLSRLLPVAERIPRSE